MNFTLKEEEIKLIEKEMSVCAAKNSRLEIKPLVKDKEIIGIAIYESTSRRLNK